ncbi:hypothetical protein [Streptomyces sp. FXY-T5]|uniref:hypothetical protein n=1 Tax=Streptomyces sp. FXY-T5 TaxID=3064901 RepID=UPI0027D32E4C|nr:hypothetical protein [Streptomyces sp. FXY-T5]WMD09254.1 hypothetical protein Q7C01_34965 [Streptomyces sp. FXY-T5]
MLVAHGHEAERELLAPPADLTVLDADPLDGSGEAGEPAQLGLRARLGPPPGPGQHVRACRWRERFPAGGERVGQQVRPAVHRARQRGAAVGQLAQGVGAGLQQRIGHVRVVRRHGQAEDRQALREGVGVGAGLQQRRDLVRVPAPYGRDQFLHAFAPLPRTTGGA